MQKLSGIWGLENKDEFCKWLNIKYASMLFHNFSVHCFQGDQFICILSHEEKFCQSWTIGKAHTNAFE